MYVTTGLSFKVEKILKFNMDLIIPSPSLSVKIQILGLGVKAKHYWTLSINNASLKVG